MPNTTLSLKTFFQVCVILALIAAMPAWGQETKKVSKVDAMRAVASRIQPEYPSNARQFRIEGSVELEVLVGENGGVEKVDIVAGNPMLTRPAANAVRAWKFTPFTEGGKAVKAMAPITISFKL
jgi:periplasmic protein TonB